MPALLPSLVPLLTALWALASPVAALAALVRQTCFATRLPQQHPELRLTLTSRTNLALALLDSLLALHQQAPAPFWPPQVLTLLQLMLLALSLLTLPVLVLLGLPSSTEPSNLVLASWAPWPQGVQLVSQYGCDPTCWHIC